MHKTTPLLAITAAALLAGCTETTPQRTQTAAEPPLAPPATPTPAEQRLTEARAEFQRARMQHVLQLLDSLTDPTSRTIIAMAQVELAPSSPDATTLLATAKSTAATLTQTPVTRSRGRVLQTWLDNPAARTTNRRDLLLDPKTPTAEFDLLLAQQFFAANDYPAGLADIRRAQRDLPNDTRIIEAAFKAALIAKDWPTAREFADNAERLNLGGSFALAYLINFHNARTDANAAIDDLKEFTRRHPEITNAWLYLGRAQLSLRNYVAARTAGEKALAIQPDSLAALKLLISLHIQRPFDDTLAPTRDYLERALRIAPRDAELDRFTDRIDTLAKVIERRTALLAAEPDNRANRINLTQALMNDRQFDKAMDIFKPVYFSGAQELDVVEVYATLMAATGHADQADLLFEPFTSAGTPDTRSKALLAKGLMYKRLGKSDLAVPAYQLALALNDKAAEGHGRLGDAYFELHKYDLAAQSYEAAIAITDNLSARRRLVQCYLQTNQFARMEPYIDGLLAEDPRELDMLALKGFAALKRNQQPEATQWFDRALAINPKHALTLYYRGLMRYELQRDLPHAIEDFEQAAAANPKGITLYILLARVYLESHQPEKADATVDRLIKNLPPQSPDIDKIRNDYSRLRAALNPQP